MKKFAALLLSSFLVVNAQLSDLTVWYKNLFTCTVCKGMVDGGLSFFKDTKYIKAVEGALGLYCMIID
jgi:hypothetical protein